VRCVRIRWVQYSTGENSSQRSAVFHKARAGAFRGEEAASLLARRPYDLRHAAVSTWLNAGVAPPQVADWAGHTEDVLLRVYAKCISCCAASYGQKSGHLGVGPSG
jgi:integrase